MSECRFITVDGETFCDTHRAHESDAAVCHYAADAQRKAVEALYYAAYWCADRTVPEQELWEAVRDAFGFTPGESTKRLGPPRETTAALQARVRLTEGEMEVRGQLLDSICLYTGAENYRQAWEYVKQLVDRVRELEAGTEPMLIALRNRVRELSGELALARDTAFWLDCRWKEPSDEPRSVDTCRLEGTHVCARCELATRTADLTRAEQTVARLRILWLNDGRTHSSNPQFVADMNAALAEAGGEECPH